MNNLMGYRGMNSSIGLQQWGIGHVQVQIMHRAPQQHRDKSSLQYRRQH